VEESLQREWRHGACRDPVTPHLLHSPCRGTVARRRASSSRRKNWQSANTLPPSPVPARVSPFGGETPQPRLDTSFISSGLSTNRMGPKTEFEQKGFWKTLRNPDRPYTEWSCMGGLVSASHLCRQGCFSGLHRCHIAHPDGPKQNFKQNDVMGAIMVSVPLSQ